MMTEDKSIINRIENIPLWFWLILPWILTVIMILNPIGFPVKVVPEIRDAFDAVEAVPEDGIVLIMCDWGLGQLVGWSPPETAVAKHLFSRGLKMVWVCSGSGETPIALEELFRYWGVFTKYGYVYGEDVVVTSYLPGLEAAFAMVSEDLKSAVSEDWHGTPISELSLIDNLYNGGDFDLLWNAATGGETSHWVVRQFYIPWGIPIIRTSTPADVAVFIGYYNAGQITGYVALEAVGAAQYELLTGMPGLGATYSDSITVMSFALVITIVLANILHISKGGIVRKEV
jgi:hypothetical protein